MMVVSTYLWLAVLGTSLLSTWVQGFVSTSTTKLTATRSLSTSSNLSMIRNDLTVKTTRPGLREDVDVIATNDPPNGSCRRDFLFNSGLLAAAAAATVTYPAVAQAASLSQEEIDKQNVVKGYKRLQYLLSNWEKETTVCGMGGDNLERRCDRTPLKVMDYMGYKSTTDPLYKAEKTLRRLYQLAPADKDAEFVEAVEAFAENADEASGMAFISSWGEANPGGGKDRVEMFIERAKKNVIVASNSLETVIKILDLPL